MATATRPLPAASVSDSVALPSGTVAIAASTPSADSSRTSTATRAADGSTPSTSEHTAPVGETTSLGPGHVAAIAVGSALGVVVLVLVVVFWTLRSRLRMPWGGLAPGEARATDFADPDSAMQQQQQQEQGPPTEVEQTPAGPPELPGNSGGPASSKPESGRVTGPFEMATALDAQKQANTGSS